MPSARGSGSFNGDSGHVAGGVARLQSILPGIVLGTKLDRSLIIDTLEIIDYVPRLARNIMV